MEKQSKTKRIYYLDRIKILLCLLVIGQHTSIVYGGAGTWYYIEGVKNLFVNVIFTIYNAVCQSFFMGLFFFISAYFTVPSYNKKGCRKFIKDRALRLIIPLALFYFILNPTTNYIVDVMTKNNTITYFSYMYKSISTLTHVGFGPLWFVEALVIFSFAYVLYRKIIKKIEFNHIKFPNKKNIFAFILILGFISFFVRIIFSSGVEIFGMKLGYFPQYIALFILGIVTYENKWLDKITDKMSSFYFKVSVLCFILLIAVLGIVMLSGDADVNKFFGGMSFQSFIYAMWEPFMCVGISLKLITYFREKHDYASKFWTDIALDTYPVFVIHAPINVFLECILISSGLNPVIKCIGVFIMTCIICFSVSHFVLRRFALFKRIF